LVFHLLVSTFEVDNQKYLKIMNIKNVTLCSFRKILLSLLLIFTLFVFIRPTFGQGKNTSDTLEYKLKKARGAERIKILNLLIQKYVLEDSIKSFIYFKEASSLAGELNLPALESNAFECLVNGLKHERAVGRFKRVLSFFQEKNYKAGIGFTLSYLGREYLLQNNFNKSEKYQKMALVTFTGINFQYGIALANERLGVYFISKDEYIKALEYFYMSLQINKNEGYKFEHAVSLYHIGLTEFYLGNYHLAVENMLQSLAYWEQVKNLPNTWNCNEILGNIYIKFELFDTALNYHRIALGIREKAKSAYVLKGGAEISGYDLGIAYSYNNLAEIYLNLHQYDSAYYYALRSLKLKEDENTGASQRDIANSQLNMGNIYAKIGKQDFAFLMLNKAANTYKTIQNISSYAEALYGIGNLYLDLWNYEKAKENYEEGLQKSIDVADKNNIKTGYKLLSDMYDAGQDHKKTLDYFRLFTNLKDSIFNKERTNIIEELQIKFEVDRKQHTIENQELVIAQKKRQFAYSLISGALTLLVAIAFIILILRNKRQKEILLQKEAENLRKDLALKEKDLELKNRELVCNVSNIYTKNMVISKVAKTLSSSMSNFKQANSELINDIISELKQNMDNTSWKEFEYRFSKVHQSFYDILDEKFPDLTPSERKICAMLKLNMSSKEIASITMTHPESVDTARSRIRKKLGLEKDENLTEFLNRL